MKLWTVQPLRFYEELQTRGVLHCDPSSDGFWGAKFPEYEAAYDWLVEQMKLRVGPPPAGVQYPLWAWALIGGKSKQPAHRSVAFNDNYLDDCVILELEIANDDILLSDEENWGFVMLNRYMHDVCDSEGRWEENAAWFNNLPPDEQERVKRKSWEKIFDEDDPDNEWKSVQACFWELRLDQVKDIRRFFGFGTRLHRKSEATP